MADALDLAIAQGPGRVDFSPIGSLPDAYWKGREEAQKQQQRDVFKGGVPTLPDGSPDYAAMSKALYQTGDVGQGTALSNLDIQRQQMRNDALASGIINPQATGQPGFPPSTSANGIASQPRPNVATPVNRGVVGDNKASITDFVSSRVTDPERAGPIIAKLAQQTGRDPNEAITDPAVMQMVVEAARPLLGGGAPQPLQLQQPAAPAAAAEPSASAEGDPTLGGLIPPGQDRQKYIDTLSAIAGSPTISESRRKTAQSRLDAIQKALEPTPEMKNARDPKVAEFEALKQRAKVAAENLALTPEQKTYYADRQPGETMAQYKARVTQMEETAKVNAQNGALTPDMKEYAANRQPGETLADYQGRKKAATDEATDQLKTLKELSEEGLSSKGRIAQLDSVAALGERVGYGIVPQIKSFLGQHGIETDGLNDIQAYQRAIDFLSPQLRPVGSGRLLQTELSAFKSALGGLMTTPEGRRLSVQNLKLLAQYQAQIGTVAADARLSPADRMKNIYAIDPPKLQTGVRQAQEPSSAPPVPDAKQAPDGHWYVPDPNRPGKYLRVRQ